MAIDDLELMANTKYWLSIFNDTTGVADIWGWATVDYYNNDGNAYEGGRSPGMDVITWGCAVVQAYEYHTRTRHLRPAKPRPCRTGIYTPQDEGASHMIRIK